MKICVLQPSYKGTSYEKYMQYYPEIYLEHLIDELNIRNEIKIHYEFLNKISVYSQIKKLSKQKFDIFINLCEGYLDSDIPSIDVIFALENLNLPYTGPNALIYDPPKNIMKYAAYCEGIRTPEYILAECKKDIKRAEKLKYPLFVKPNASGDSNGIDENSLIENRTQLKEKTSVILKEFDKALIEEFIEGREFSVLVLSNPDSPQQPIALKPVEFLFKEENKFKFKTHNLKLTQFLPDRNMPCNDKFLNKKLKDASVSIFKSFSAVGYARMDYRVDNYGNIYFLEANFACSVLYPEKFYGTADYILKYDGLGQAGFLKHIIDEGIKDIRKIKNRLF